MKAAARFTFTLLIIIASAAGAYELWDYYMLSPWTRDARVYADVVDIAPDVAGFAHEILVKDNQFVHRGEVLFVIDQERYKYAVVNAEATVAARKADMEMRQHEAQRRKQLTTLSISVEGREDAQYVANDATATYMQALADLSTARLNLERTVIRAPVNGFVTNLKLDVGDYVSVGTMVMALIDSDSYRVYGYFEETKIPRVASSTRVSIYLMSGAPPLQGHVTGIARGITDTDSPNGPQLLANVPPTFEWVRLAQRIPVEIHIDKVPEGVLVSSGMTCTVVVRSGPRESAVARLLRDTVVVARELLSPTAYRKKADLSAGALSRRAEVARQRRFVVMKGGSATQSTGLASAASQPSARGV